MTTSFAWRVSIPEGVMFRELEGETVILALDSESYFGLDQIGTRMRITELVIHFNRHVLPHQSQCLLESLTLWYLLRRNGFDADLVLGAHTLPGPLEAHAWVELEGEVLNDGPHVRHIYEPFELRGVAARPESR